MYVNICLICFNLFQCIYVLHIFDAFYRATIIPLVKCKLLIYVNNYRTASCLSLQSFISSGDDTDEHQFRLKKTIQLHALCAHVFHKTVKYNRENGSHVMVKIRVYLNVLLICITDLILSTILAISVN